MRHAGDQHDAQPVAHAGHRHNCAIVGQRQLVLARRGGQLDDILAFMRDRHADLARLADLDAAVADGLAVHRQRHFGGAGGALHTQIVDPHFDFGILADNGEARGGGDAELAVLLVMLARHQNLQRTLQGHVPHISGRVMDLTVGDDNRARHPARRHIGDGGVERREGLGAVIVAARRRRDRGFAHREVGHAGQRPLHRIMRGLRLPRAVADTHALRPVGDDHRHIVQGRARLMHRDRTGQCRQQQDEHKRASPGAFCVARETPDGQRCHGNAKRDQPFQRDQGCESQAGHLSRPSLCSRAGACTWSVL